MAEKRPKNMIRFKGNFFNDALNYIKLIVRLMGDGRVNPFLKLIPIGSLAYLIWPIDVPGPLDDAAILGLGFYLFLEFCPKDVVEEHVQLLQGFQNTPWMDVEPSEDAIPTDKIIDAEFREKKP